MTENYTLIPTIVFFLLAFIGILPEGNAQCDIVRDRWAVQSENTGPDGTKYKRVQFRFYNDFAGPLKQFLILLDDEERDGTQMPYKYGNLEEVDFPVETKKITIQAFNNEKCSYSFDPGFEPEQCKIPIEPHIDLDVCYKGSASFILKEPGTVIDSVVWLRNGGTKSVHDDLVYNHIPPGSYEIFIYGSVNGEEGCFATSSIKTCTTRANAGNNIDTTYCIGSGDVVDLWNALDPAADRPGEFRDQAGNLLDSADVRHLTFDTEALLEYRYITKTFNELADTARISIDVRDCNVCDYELISASRLCTDSDSVSVVIDHRNPEVRNFEVTLPDDRIITEEPRKPFLIYWPDTDAELSLGLHADAPYGSCDTTLELGSIAPPRIQIEHVAEELDDPDSFRIWVVVSEGAAPYETTLTNGSYTAPDRQLKEATRISYDILKRTDTVWVEVTDALGCTAASPLVLGPDCELPEADSIAASCGQNNGQIRLYPGKISDDFSIEWEGMTETDTVLTGLAPGTYHYTFLYENCKVENSITVEATTSYFPKILTDNDCLLDGVARFYIEDSTEVNQWFLDGKPLSGFSVELPVNKAHTFTVENMEGCDSVFDPLTAEESTWLERLEFEEPNRLVAVPGRDQEEFTNCGWIFRNETELCHDCTEFTAENPLLNSGVYLFYIEQNETCRQDTTLTVQQNGDYFKIPNVLSLQSEENCKLQIFDPLRQMASISELQIYDRYGNVLHQLKDVYPDENSCLNWPSSDEHYLPNIVVCVARIKCKSGEEILVSQDILILR